jgi:hypothetical protein
MTGEQHSIAGPSRQPVALVAIKDECDDQSSLMTGPLAGVVNDKVGGWRLP